MTARRRKPILGRWRIVEADLWAKDYLDMVEPAHITFQANGTGEFAFGCVNATLRCHYSHDGASFTWAGFDEMTEVSGEGSADITDNGMLEGEIAFCEGDEAQFKAQKE